MPEVVVRNWPLVDGGWLRVVVALGTVAVGSIAWWQTENVALALASILAVGMSMWRFWLPVVFRIHRRGIDERCLIWRRSVGWRNIQACRMLERGALVRCRPVEQFDGRPLRYIEWHDQREAVIEALNFYCGTAIVTDSRIF